VTKRRLRVLTVTGIVVAGLAAAGVITLAQPFSHQPAATTPLGPVSDVNASTRACLFEAPAGNPAQQPALQGLTEAAQARKNILVQQFTVPANVSPAAMLAELTALHCRTIVTVGSQAAAQVEAQARSSRGTHYLVIGFRLPATPNVTVMPASSATPGAVESAVLQITGT
jgi:hypothetical protein